MKNFAALCILSASLCLPSTSLSQWVSVGDGIDYQAFTASGPNNLFVSRMARNNTNAIIDTSIAKGTISGAVEIVRSQAARQDDAITWWGEIWGTTNNVVATINGGFYDIGGTNIISGGQVQSGWLAHSFLDSAYPNATNSAFSGFAWKNDRTAFHGECVSMTSNKVYVTFVSAGASMPINWINIVPPNNKLVVFTPQYNTQTPIGERTEVLVEMARPNLTTSGGNYSSGIIRSVKTNSGSNWIPFDHIILSASGDAGITLNNSSAAGTEIRIFQEIIESNEPDVQGNNACQTPTGVDWSNVFSCINTNYHFLKNNVVRIPDAVAHPGYQGYVNLNPRTAICWNANYVFFVICDGRNPGVSIGMSCETLGNWAKSVLGATDGVNLDGGGSSTMVVNGTVMNRPSDGPERAVCNGIMMVNVQPMQQSSQLTTGQLVTANAQANCRLGPGTNYGIIGTIASGSQGIVIAHGINGVWAKDFYWWKCNFNGTVGWVAESLLLGGGILPTVATHPSSQTLAVGETATFSITAAGSTPISYQWQQNNVNLSNGGHYAGVTTATLTVSNADTSDVANYRCVVSNSYGTATSEQAALTLSGQPTITLHPTPQNVCMGGTATFTIAASAQGALTYRWQKNGANLSDGGHYSGTLTPTVMVSNVDVSNAGNYRCVVTNAAGSTSSNSASLGIDMVYAVTGMGGANSTISGVSSDGTVVAGKNTNGGFIWTVTNGVVGLGAGTSTAGIAIKNGSIVVGGLYGGAAARWDGNAAGAGTWTTLPTAGSAWTPLCTSAQNGSPGNVWIAGNSGSATGTRQAVSYRESTASTSVLALPPSGNMDALIYGVSDVGNYAGQYQYSKVSPSGSRQAMGGSPLTALSPIIGPPSTKNESIAKTISRDGTKAGGWSWAVGTSQQATIWTIANPTLPIAVPFLGTDDRGEILALNADGTLAAGWAATGGSNQHAIIWDAANGTRDLQTWLLTQHGLATPGWVFTEVKGMSADSKVIAGNGMYNGNSQAWVVLLGVPGTVPSITTQPIAQALCAGDEANFAVTATGLGVINYQWQFNGSNLTDSPHYTGATTSTLHITGISAEDIGDYRCVVSVGCGNTTSNPATLALKPATSINQQPTARYATLGATSQFTVAAIGGGTLSYQWQQNDTPLTEGGRYSGSTTATLSISNVNTTDAASYSCIVTGDCGSAVSEAVTLTVLLLPQPGDFNGDGDVDPDDLADFVNCALGPEITQPEPNCYQAKLDADDDVDMDDFAIMQRCYSGENILGNPGCED